MQKFLAVGALVFLVGSVFWAIIHDDYDLRRVQSHEKATDKMVEKNRAEEPGLVKWASSQKEAEEIFAK